MDRALREFRVRGVKTNIPFLENVVNHPAFSSRAKSPHDSSIRRRRCSASRTGGTAPPAAHLSGEVIVNGNPEVAGKPRPRRIRTRARFRRTIAAQPPAGTRQLLETGRRKIRRMDAIAEAAADHRHDIPRRAPIADGDARPHHDMLAIAKFVAHRLHNLYSLEMWGGATFDVAMRFLLEDPWQRLRRLREAIPNICFQMLLRASNAVGYTAYPDNVVREFIRNPPRRASIFSASSIRSTGCRT